VSMVLNGDLLFYLSQLVSLHYLGKDKPQKLGFFSHALYGKWHWFGF